MTVGDTARRVLARLDTPRDAIGAAQVEDLEIGAYIMFIDRLSIELGWNDHHTYQEVRAMLEALANEP